MRILAPVTQTMVTSIGLDIVETARIELLLQKYGERLPSRLLGRQELLEYNRRADKAAFLAGRFAAKEAVIKGLGRFLTNRPSWTRIEIVNDETGQPSVSFDATVNERLKAHRFLISISHERNLAAAVAVFSEEK